MDEIEAQFMKRLQEQAENERTLKKNMSIVQKHSEDIEKERTNERTLRLKLEDELV